MQAYLQRLEPYVLTYPDQWLGWPFTGDHYRTALLQADAGTRATNGATERTEATP